MPTETSSPAHDPLADPALRRSLEDFVRRRVPSSDVDDVVQTVLLDALAAQGRPRDPGELRRWILGIARHKVVDLHRRAHREPPAELPEIEASPAPIEARELVRWAEEQAGSAGEAKKTLDWMAREGEGEKLEAIAAEEQVPAARVRQRVSRMRRWMKEKWMAELAAVAMLGALALAAWWLLRRPSPEARDQPEPPEAIAPERPAPLDRARVLRADALQACEKSEWRPCLDGLDQARALDPEGDAAPAIGAARAKALDALQDKPAPSSTAAPIIKGSKESDIDEKGGKKDAPFPKSPAPTKGKPSGLDEKSPSETPGPAVKPAPTGGTGTLGGSSGFEGKPAPKRGKQKKAFEKVLDSNKF